jgi:Rrf2 family cysteine metabolism transcriptional repressor
MSSLIGVSLKCQYALRAMFELSSRFPTETISTVADIAEVQNIPPRFLEQIFSKLRTAGFIESRRGKQGGYILAVKPSSMSVGQIIHFIEGPDDSIQCIKSPNGGHCPTRRNGCVFKDLWTRAKDSIAQIFDATTFQDLVDKQKTANSQFDYAI